MRRATVALFAIHVVLLSSIALPTSADHAPTYGGLHAEEWAAIAAQLEADPPTYGGLTAGEWGEVAKLLPPPPPDPLPHHEFAPHVEQAIADAAARFGVSAYLVAEIARCESGGNPAAVNPSSGALGLGQHLPRYWADRAAAAGHPGASGLDAIANADTTAWLLATSGTSPWAPWSGHCSSAY